MEKSEGISSDDVDYFLPIIADAEAGFGGPLNVFELMKSMIEAGASGVISKTNYHRKNVVT